MGQQKVQYDGPNLDQLVVTPRDSSGNLMTGGGAAIVPTATTLQNAAVANGNGTNLAVAGYATALLQIVASPAMSGGTTVNFEGSADGGTTWVSVVAHLLGTAASQVTTTTSNGDYRINCAGLSHLRARISGYSAGTVTVTGYASPLAGSGTAVAVSNLVQPAALGQGTMAQSLPVVLAQGGALTDRSGTIAAGGTRQASTAVSNAARRYLYIENPAYKADGSTVNTAERLCFNLTGNAGLGAGSICLDIGQSFEYSGAFVPTGAVDVIASTTAHGYTIWEG